MTKEKWLETAEFIRSKFEVVEDSVEDLFEGQGEIRTVVFESPDLGKIKLQWHSQPKLLQEKTVYSNRIGSDVKVEKVYDQSEKVNFLKAFRFDKASGDWQEIKADSFLV